MIRQSSSERLRLLRLSGGMLFASALALGACSAADPSEDTSEVSEEGLSGVTALTAVSSGKCVEVVGSSAANGADRSEPVLEREQPTLHRQRHGRQPI